MDILFFLAAFVSEIIGTIAGFGSSTIFLPLALFFFDFQTALVLSAFLHLFGNLGRIGFFRHGMDKGLILKFGIPSIILTLIGALAVPLFDQVTLKGILGIFLIMYSSYSLWREKFPIAPSALNAVTGGALSGLIAGLIGTGGALRGAFLTGFKLPKKKYIATAAAIAIASDLSRIPIYLSQGFLDKNFYWYLLPLFLIALLGSYTGKLIVDKIPQQKFSKFILSAILLIGIKFMYDWLL